MAINFFDTSAINKHYHAEVGTSEVNSLLSSLGDKHIISRLTIVEFSSAFAKKVRTGTISKVDFDKATQKLRFDLKHKKYSVTRMLVEQFQLADRLIRKLGASANLRTLDAVQLATALHFHQNKQPIRFICADKDLCKFATDEGLQVINPELP